MSWTRLCRSSWNQHLRFYHILGSTLFCHLFRRSVDDSGLMLHFFGEDGTKKLDLAAFNAFLTGLHAEIDRLEFQHYDPRSTVSNDQYAAQCSCRNERFRLAGSKEHVQWFLHM